MFLTGAPRPPKNPNDLPVVRTRFPAGGRKPARGRDCDFFPMASYHPTVLRIEMITQHWGSIGGTVLSVGESGDKPAGARLRPAKGIKAIPRE